MILQTVNASYQRVVNLGDYSSVRIGMDVSVAVEEGEDTETVALAARAMVKNNVMAEVACYKEQLRAVVESLYMGLPVAEEEDDPQGDTVDDNWRDGNPLDFGNKE